MDVAHINPAGWNLHGTDHDRALSDRVVIQVAVRNMGCDLVFGDRESVRGVDEEVTEIAGIVRVRYQLRWRSAELTEEGTQACRDADEIRGRKQQDRVLD